MGLQAPDGDSAPKREFSSTLKAMKFMQRGEEAALRKKLEAERDKEMREAQWVVSGTGAGAAAHANEIVVEDESVGASQFRSGRKSFGRFNPKIEVRREQCSCAHVR
jgi:hypothetical protein